MGEPTQAAVAIRTQQIMNAIERAKKRILYFEVMIRALEEELDAMKGGVSHEN